MEAPQHSRGNGSAQSQRWQDTARPLSCKQIWKIGLRMFSYVFLYSSHGSLCCDSPWQTAWPLEAPAHFGPLIQPAQGVTTDIWTHSDEAQLIVFSHPTCICPSTVLFHNLFPFPRTNPTCNLQWLHLCTQCCSCEACAACAAANLNYLCDHVSG